MCFHVNANQGPKLPKSQSDPTGIGGLRKRSINDLKRRLAGAEKEVLKLFSKVPYTTKQVKEISNSFEINFNHGVVAFSIEPPEPRDYQVNEKYYVYEMDSTQLENFDAEIRAIVNKWLETTPENKPPRWFFDVYVDQSYGKGTNESLTNMQRIAPLDFEVVGQPFSAAQFEQILLSEPYRKRIELVRARTFNGMKGFSGDTAKDLSVTLQNAMAAGDGVNNIKSQIRKRFGVADSRAERIARTETNRAYTDSRMDMNKQARDDLGLNTAVMHISALAPTSRREHVRRSGNVYTPEQQERWWNTGANRINCLCSITEVLIDDNGDVINTEAQDIVKQDKSEYLESDK